MDRFLRYLRPDTLFDWILYLIMVLALITLMLQGKRGTLTMTILLSITIMGSLIDKINQVNQQLYANASFSAYLVHIVMFVAPVVVAGMTKADKSRGWAIMAALIAAVYLFGFWFVNQRLA